MLSVKLNKQTVKEIYTPDEPITDTVLFQITQ